MLERIDKNPNRFQHKCIDVLAVVCTLLIGPLALGTLFFENNFCYIIFFINYMIALIAAVLKNVYLHEIF